MTFSVLAWLSAASAVMASTGRPSAPTSMEAADTDNDGWFTVTGSSLQGPYLVITYTIRYPGMTKVRLFDERKRLLWRSQYVNTTEGEHKLVLKREKLEAGSYTFEFDYKDRLQTFHVTI